MASNGWQIEVRGLTVAYGNRVVQRELSFTVGRGKIFVIMGESGCGKSTVLRSLIGLLRPAAGAVLINGTNLWDAPERDQVELLRNTGVLFQNVALWSSMTLAENIALPIRMAVRLGPEQMRALVGLKLSMVGLAGCADLYPHELSGGMRKRAGLARAIALDPEILFFDEPTAGLDPVNARRLDDLIVAMRDTTGATTVVVTHELASIFAIGDEALYLDGTSKTAIARGSPRELLAESTAPRVRAFLTRGEVSP